MKDRPVVLTFNKFYLPGYRAGGPIRTLANMVDRLGDCFDFRIVTLDRDAGDTNPYPTIQLGEWTPVGKAKVMYLSTGDITISKLINITLGVGPQVIYLNSFFDPTFTQRILLARRLGKLGKTSVIVAPRGEFSEGALRLKNEKKRAYLFFSRIIGLYRNLTWQASSTHERADIRRNLPFVDESEIIEAMNLAPVDAEEINQPIRRQDGEPLRVCFLSRISPMKNLDFALRALSEVKSEVFFRIYGPKEDTSYWIKCKDLIEALPLNIHTTYEGELVPAEVKKALSDNDLFLLPTRGENYGHVIHEALSAGLPVLISDQTPWSEVEARGIGWVLPLSNPKAFASAIDDYATWESTRIQTTKKNAMNYAAELSKDDEIVEANYKMLKMVATKNK